MSKILNELSSHFSHEGSKLTIDDIMTKIKAFDPHADVSFRDHKGAVWSITSTSDNSYFFSGSEDKTIMIWSGVDHKCISTLEGHTNITNVLEIIPDDKFLLSGCWSGKLFIWE